MSVREFLDANILIYAYDPTNPEKQAIAQKLLQRAGTGEVAISTQVLGEFAATLLHKKSPRVDAATVTAILSRFSPIPVISPDAEMIARAVEAHGRYQIHFYDAMIIAAAERGGCSRIWSEDLNSGQHYFGIAVKNPFK